jgi:hypothetical protein
LLIEAGALNTHEPKVKKKVRVPHEENSAGMATRREEMRRVPVGGGGLGAPGGVRRDGTLRAAHCLSARDWLAGVRGVVVPATESRCHVRGARRSADRQRASHRRTRRQMLRKQMLLRSPATGAGGYPHRRRPSSSARRLRRGTPRPPAACPAIRTGAEACDLGVAHWRVHARACQHVPRGGRRATESVTCRLGQRRAAATAGGAEFWGRSRAGQ